MVWSDGLIPGSSSYNIAADTSTRIRVIAGPGTGKSHALKHRVTRLLEDKVAPSKILAATFTKVAAEDLHRDLLSLKAPGADKLQGQTIHGICADLLRKDDVIQKLGRHPRVLGRFELKNLISDLSIDFHGVKNTKNLLAGYEAAWAKLQADTPGYPSTAEEKAFSAALKQWLVFHKAMTIGELVPMAYKYLLTNPTAEELTRFSHILVDEYQDLNKVEQALINLLATKAELFVVGDDDQSLYSFKHAHPDGIRDFNLTHPTTNTHSLAECQRSPTTVVECANALISNNTVRIPKTLTPLPSKGAGSIAIIQYKNMDEEIAGIISLVQKQLANGVAPGEILILAQRRQIGIPLRKALSDAGIPVKSYYDEQEIAEFDSQVRLAILRQIINPEDYVSLRFLLDVTPPIYKRIYDHSLQKGLTLRQTLDALASGALSLPYCAPAVPSYKIINDAIQTLTPLKADLQKFIDEWLPANIAKLSEIRALALNVANGAADFDEFTKKLIKEISFPEPPLEIQEVRIMSIHKSKGLSAPVVIIPWCLQGLIPIDFDPDKSNLPNALSHSEEQRRLFYVGITRVKAQPDVNKGPIRTGELFITSSRQTSFKDAKAAGINFKNSNTKGIVTCIASEFITELGPHAPKPIAG